MKNEKKFIVDNANLNDFDVFVECCDWSCQASGSKGSSKLIDMYDDLNINDQCEIVEYLINDQCEIDGDIPEILSSIERQAFAHAVADWASVPDCGHTLALCARMTPRTLDKLQAELDAIAFGLDDAIKLTVVQD